jgi:hypothetical protein
VSLYEQEMRECFGVGLGVSPPSPEYEALLFFKQWLAERNLGLVPIANASASAFDWPGHWLARVRSVRLPIEEPYGQDPQHGRVEAILTAADAESPLVRRRGALALQPGDGVASRGA